jgi:hypothetical protein
MSPRSFAMVVLGLRLATYRAHAIAIVLDQGLNAASLKFELCCGHPPRRFESQKTAEKVQVLHTQALHGSTKILYASHRNS